MKATATSQKVVRIELQASQEIIYAFEEFLREQMISPIDKSADSPNGKKFSASFTEHSAKTAVDWLRVQGIDVDGDSKLEINNAAIAAA